jgi:cystathionine gamma-synthase
MEHRDGQRAEHLATRFAHAGLRRSGDDGTGAVSTPVYRSAVFRHRAYGEADTFTYSRLANPTRTALEEAVADLCGGARAFAFSSGMAALHTAFSLLRPGDRLLACKDLYGHTYRLLVDHVAARGVQVHFVDTWDAHALVEACSSRLPRIPSCG